MNKAIIFAGAKISGVNIKNISDYYVVAVDRGLEYIIDNNIKYDVALGDFDSVRVDYLNKLKEDNIEIISFNKDKDMTDLELAIKYVIDKNISEVIIYGAIGSRFDHSLENIFMLKKYEDINIKLINQNNIVQLVNKSTKIYKNDKYKYISLLPTNEPCIFSISGVKWPLKNHELEYGSSLTISNEIVDVANIDIHRGDLFLIQSRD